MKWLEEQRSQQVRVFGVDPTLLDGDDLAEYVRWNVLAANVELSELMDTIQWKPWKPNQGDVKEEYERRLDELCDVLAFVGNIALALGITSSTHVWQQARIKQEVVRDRADAADDPRAYRTTFFKHNGTEPWACHFCEEDVFADELHVHHLDGLRVDNSAENLAATHQSCHAAHHARVRAEKEMRTSGPFTCPWCDRQFARQSGLVGHISHAHRKAGRHTRKPKNVEDRTVRVCEECGRECAGARSYNSHTRMAHGPESLADRNLEVYTRWLNGESTHDLGQEYSISPSTVKGIVWRHKKKETP